VKATGQRRKSGPSKGAKGKAKLPAGSRTVKSLAAVCQSEGLPQSQEVSSGERRTVEAAGCEAFVAQVAAAQVVRRRSKLKAG